MSCSPETATIESSDASHCKKISGTRIGQESQFQEGFFWGCVVCSNCVSLYDTLVKIASYLMFMFSICFCLFGIDNHRLLLIIRYLPCWFWELLYDVLQLFPFRPPAFVGCLGPCSYPALFFREPHASLADTTRWSAVGAMRSLPRGFPGARRSLQEQTFFSNIGRHTDGNQPRLFLETSQYRQARTLETHYLQSGLLFAFTSISCHVPRTCRFHSTQHINSKKRPFSIQSFLTTGNLRTRLKPIDAWGWRFRNIQGTYSCHFF